MYASIIKGNIDLFGFTIFSEINLGLQLASNSFNTLKYSKKSLQNSFGQSFSKLNHDDFPAKTSQASYTQYSKSDSIFSWYI